MSVKTDSEYFDLLGMLGMVIAHCGGKVEIPFKDIQDLDLTKKELTNTFNPETNKFVFELKDVASVG